MPRILLISVRLHEGRYHGEGDNPPSPARLFQALTAAAGLGGPLCADEKNALNWLERLDPPVIASPRLTKGQSFKNYLPSNDLDAKGGDHRRIASIRGDVKTIRPLLLDARMPFLYAWIFEMEESGRRHASTICALAEKLYQFGRGVDMAWAWGEELDDKTELERRLASYPGLVHRPLAGGGRPLRCPSLGTLDSLVNRYAANAKRFQVAQVRRKDVRNFLKPPRARFVQGHYDSPPKRTIYELRERGPDAPFAVWPLERTAKLVETLRDVSAARLRDALPAKAHDIECVLIGRKANGADDGPTTQRVRIVPLPSIGHHHADQEIRRVLVEVPAGGPLRSDDVNWAFDGIEIDSLTGGKPLDVTPTEAEDMLKHYGVNDRFRVWRTMTPAALPESARRRRIDPEPASQEVKAGAERGTEQQRAAGAVFHALRHTRVRCRPEEIRVQREPFEAHGRRVEAFAPGTRFAKEQLWHVEIRFNEPVAGPLAIGDGRFLGLGVMAPVRQRTQGVHAFTVEGELAANAQPGDLARALRRAVMARVQQELGKNRRLSAFFTGHEFDGTAARSETQPHLSFLFDPKQTRLMVVAPHLIERRPPTAREKQNLATLDRAMSDFCELRAGSAGCLTLVATSIDFDSDPLFAPSRIWTSVTSYRATRHKKRVGAAEALSADLRTECRRRRFPVPRVTPIEMRGVPGVGLVADMKLEFNVAVTGPMVLGRSRHLGGGLFEGSPE